MKSKHDEILQNLSKWHKEKAKGQQAEKLFLGSLRASRAIKNSYISLSINVELLEMKTWWNTLKLSKCTRKFFGTEKRFLGSLRASRAIKNLNQERQFSIIYSLYIYVASTYICDVWVESVYSTNKLLGSGNLNKTTSEQ